MQITKNLITLFANWTKLKIRVHVSDKTAYPNRKQIWWASLGQNIKSEINGKGSGFDRPVLVLKKFNADTCLVAPISSKIKTGDLNIKFINPDGFENIVKVGQVRTISNSRLIRKVGKIDDDSFTKIANVFRNLV